jgi:hypothetical protein
MPKDVEIIALDIYNLFISEFGGKTRGRFFLSKEDMRILADRTNLQDSTVLSIMKELNKNHDLVLVVAGASGYGVIEEKKVYGWRSVPKRLL